jgi:hypothetical protein
MGTPESFAAIYAGALTYPPKPTTAFASFITFVQDRTDASRSRGTFNHEVEGLREIRTLGIKCSGKLAAGTSVVSSPLDVPKKIN